MAGPIKKRAVAQENESNSESEQENGETDQKEIEATFEGRNPEASDFHGIKQLLQQLFLKAHIDLSQLSDMIISSNVGSVLKQSVDDDEDEEDENDDDMDVDDVFGVTTVLNLTEKKNVDCIDQLRSLLVQLAETHGTEKVTNTIKNILNDDTKHVGLLINERFINIPAQISDPLFESLLKEINSAKSKKLNFDFGYFVLICKLHKQDVKKSGNKNPEIYFSNAEEEVFDEEADIKFEFSVKNESDSGVGGNWLEEDETMTPYRRVLIFPADKLPSIIQRIKGFVAKE